MKKNYTKTYDKTIGKINLPMNIITRIFLSKFSPLKKNFINKKILDFSCGSGPYLNFLNDLKFKVFATEITKEIISKLKKKFPNVSFRVSDNIKIDFNKNYFDYVLCNHSIYYLSSENQKFKNTINEIKRVTKVGGIIICTFPTINQYHLKFKRVKKQTYKIIYDKYNIRKNGYFNLFKNSADIQNYFKKDFKIIELGKQMISFGELNESFYILILKKK
ncbi:class I SAM-dependent methyltransferase [Candidatus Pelagibacter sp. HIMB1506]|uniref:class I SAM-dependent methyltransferase n=1 Tax=Candidatus Pelagibacter sp. HIMB1506 TaxID=3413337 RepID=UPI003F84D28D